MSRESIGGRLGKEEEERKETPPPTQKRALSLGEETSADPQTPRKEERRKEAA